MAARVIDGKAVAGAVKERVKVDLVAFEEEFGRVPGLATVLVGADPASEVYVGMKVRACEEVGIRSIHQQPEASIRQEDLEALVEELNADDEVDGILVQMPLPDHLDSDRIVALIDPDKDVDGLTPVNAGLLAHGTPGLVPATPSGCMDLLPAVHPPLGGGGAVGMGRSTLVGKPIGWLLLAANATVTQCH